tara:strand:+ start:3568 stop:3870 length:303 start_codon:yes stop_codon:yes gene_type:complete
MKKAIANKLLDITSDEYKYIVELQEAFGEDVFLGLFTSNDEGIVTSITPNVNRPVPMAVVFFILNIMMNQRLRDIDSFSSRIRELGDRLKKVEECLDEKI